LSEFDVNMESVIGTLFELMEKNEVIGIAKGIKVTIPGFTPKNFKNAPIGIIKKNTQKKVIKADGGERFIKAFLSPFEDDFEKLSPQEFNMKIKMNESISTAQAFALVVKYYPDLYQKYNQIIKQNTKDKIDLFDGIIEEKITLAQQLNVIVHTSDLKETLNAWVESNKAFIDLDKINGYSNLEEGFVECNKKKEAGYYVALLNKYYEEWNSYNEEEKQLLLKLAFHDSIHYNDRLFEFSNKILDTKDEQILSLEQEKSNLEKQGEKYQYSNQELVNEVSNLKQKLEEITKENNRFETQIKKLEKEVEKNSHDYEKLKIEKGKLEKLRDQVNETIFEKDNFILLSKSKNSLFTSQLKEEQFIQFKSIAELIKIIKNYISKGKVLFINEEGLSTKDQFLIENEIKNNNISFKWLSGDTKSIIRKIAFYLEGDKRYEVS
jgi:hypothetical protein